MKKKKTLGQHAIEIVKNPHVLDHSPEEQAVSMLHNFEPQMEEAAIRGKQLFSGDFFLEYILKKEHNINNAIHAYFVPRQTCPTPNYDQSVFKYHVISDDFEYLWTLPDKKTYEMIMDRSGEIDAHQKDLVKFVFDDADGLLLQLCKQLNGEIY